jgi:hypothetical protein
VAERYKARVCGLLLAGIAGSNPAAGMDVCIVCSREISNMSTMDIKVHNEQKQQQKTTKKKGTKKKLVIATLYGLERPGIESGWAQDFLNLFRPALGPTQPPIR